eukprot:2475404-Amphidinium_carterae.2
MVPNTQLQAVTVASSARLSADARHSYVETKGVQTAAKLSAAPCSSPFRLLSAQDFAEQLPDTFQHEDNADRAANWQQLAAEAAIPPVAPSDGIKLKWEAVQTALMECKGVAGLDGWTCTEVKFLTRYVPALMRELFETLTDAIKTADYRSPFFKSWDHSAQIPGQSCNATPSASGPGRAGMQPFIGLERVVPRDVSLILSIALSRTGVPASIVVCLRQLWQGHRYPSLGNLATQPFAPTRAIPRAPPPAPKC